MTATQIEPSARRLNVGAEPTPQGTSFRVWAPKRRSVAVLFADGAAGVDLDPDDDGYFTGFVADAGIGTLYKFKLDGGEAFPDPVSRFQPEGPHGWSQVVDPSAFGWSDDTWRGIGPDHQVVYEMHIGTFTKLGTWAAATKELRRLKQLGITCLEVMPVSDFPGSYGWGYDGVDLFAPTHLYGTPDDFRRFVDVAHSLGLAVILDVVYNHLGPDGNFIKEFTDTFFNPDITTDWGDALNFDGEGSEGVRDFFVANAVHWITEYHLDGFRFDATQAILDSSDEHILAVINRVSREAAGQRQLYMINENEPQHTRLVRPASEDGFGLDALWNDDFHHSAMVALTGHNEAYYTDYFGTAQEFISAAKWGYLYQGQRYKWQEKRRGTPGLDLPPSAFVHFIQNHDQVANSGRGQRVHQVTSPQALRAMTVLWLLMPQTPLIFQGQEYAAPNTFHYFADHTDELNKLICGGRAKELSQFNSVATPQMQSNLIDPCDRSTFERSQLDHADRDRPGHAEVYRLHADLLRLRREDPVFGRVHQRGDIDGAVLGPSALVLRYFAVNADEDRLIVANLGTDLTLNPAPEPLLAPPSGFRWAVALSSEDPAYGGNGTPHPDTEKEGWHLYGRSAIVLRPEPTETAAVKTRVVRSGTSQAARKKEFLARSTVNGRHPAAPFDVPRSVS